MILDLSMPVMDGFEFLARLPDLKLANSPEIVIFSAMHLDETMRASLSDKCIAVLNKNEMNSESDVLSAVSRALA